MLSRMFFLPLSSVSVISCRNFARTGAKRDGAGQMQDQDVPHLPVEMFEGHAATVAPRDYRCQQTAIVNIWIESKGRIRAVSSVG